MKDTASHLLTLCQKELRALISTVHDDFYSHGVDSLQAIQLRRQILGNFKFADGAIIPQNLVYDTGNISRLAEAIYVIQNCQDTQQEDERAMARNWIEKYSLYLQSRLGCSIAPESSGTLAHPDELKPYKAVHLRTSTNARRS